MAVANFGGGPPRSRDDDDSERPEEGLVLASHAFIMTTLRGCSLPAVLTNMRAQVIQRFLDEVHKRKLTPAPLPERVVLDHMPDFLDEIVSRLRASDDPSDAVPSFGEVKSAREHASVRWRFHYDLGMMIREYEAIRDAVVSVTEEAGANVTLRDFIVLSNWITVGVAEAVDEYDRQQSEELRVTNERLQAATEKLESEKANAEAERRRLDTILEILPVGLVIADEQGQVVRTNTAHERIWGGSRSAKHAGSRAWSADEGVSVEAEQRALGRSLRAGGIVMNEELDIVGLDGTPKTILVSSSPIRDATGGIVGAVAVNVDITERKQMLLRAQAAIAIRDEVVAVVSHDLRDPLGVIDGNALYVEEMLSRSDVEVDVGALRQRIEPIRRASMRMLRLISDLLDVTRIEEGRLPLTKEDWRAADLVRAAAEELKAVAAPKGIPLCIEINGDEGLVVCGDWHRILQVFANLVGNSAKFTPRGGTITLGVDCSPREYRFYVRDTGIGIDEKQLPHVFDRFWKARERDRSRKGIGLGLAIAKGIVEAHGGRIWAESSIGHGTTVFFTVPHVTTSSRRVNDS
ncbi:MAG: Sensory box histidine kinase [Myxococcaceae bacterium]|nr:Sensory box histidine kinase [Myxococcaceae bacterium]